MPKWHFSSNSRIIWIFPPCSEGSHIASSFFEETSPKLAARLGPLALILGFFLFGLFSPTALAAPQAILVEALASFLLAFVIIAVATDRRAAPGAAGLAIGLTVTVDALWAGPLTGASMNPARSLGPALAAGALGGLWLYLTVPVVGACLGMAAYGFLRGGSKPEAPLGSLGAFDLREEP